MKNPEDLIKEARSLNKRKEYTKVIELLSEDKLESFNNDDLYLEKANAFISLGNVHYDLKQYDKAIEYYNNAIKIDPNDADPYNGLGNVHAELKQYDKAIEYYNNAIKIDPNDADPYNGLGNVHAELKQYDKAIEYYNNAIKIDPNDADPYNGLGNVHYDLEQYDKAIEYYNNAIKIDPNDAYVYNGLGNVHTDLKQYDKAIEYYNNAIKIDPNDADPYNGLGNVHYVLKQYDKAIEYYNNAIKIDPNDVDPYNGLGNVHTDLKQYDKAIEYYNNAIKINPNYATAFYNLGLTYKNLNEYDKAIEYYNNAIKIDPNDVDPYNGLGNVHTDLKQYDKAIEYYNNAIKIDQNNAYAYNGLGNVHYDLEQFDKAIKYYNNAIKIDPNYTSAFYNLGLIYENLNEYEKSQASYKKYADLTKSNPDYYTTLANSKITELQKLVDNVDFSRISELVNKIKEILLFNGKRITHYTSLSAAKALILDKSLFRLSEGAFLNDTSEGRELLKYFSLHFSSNIGDDDTVAETFAQKPFIGSFVNEDKDDDLTLWRMYGKEEKEEAKGCTITINMEKLLENIRDSLVPPEKSSNFSKTTYEKLISKQETSALSINIKEFNFYRVAYRKLGHHNQFVVPGIDKEKEETLNELMKKLHKEVEDFESKTGKKTSDFQILKARLNEIAFLFKSAEYQYENELRLVVNGIGLSKIVDTKSFPPRVYLELIEIRPLIDKITLGPKVERPDEWAAAFYHSLNEEGNQPEINISHLPFK